MPEPCTPSTEHVRAVYAAQHGAILADEHGREFDRWLAEHDDEVLALGRQRAADAVNQSVGGRPRTGLEVVADAARRLSEPR